MSGALTTYRAVWPQEPEIRFRKAGTSVPAAPALRDRQDEARMLRKRGWTWDGIARRYGITALDAQVLVLGRTAADADGVSEAKMVSRALEYRRRAEVTSNQAVAYRWTFSHLAQLDTLVREGLSTVTIAQRIGCDRRIVAAKLRDRGWAWNGRVWKRALGGGERTEAAE